MEIFNSGFQIAEAVLSAGECDALLDALAVPPHCNGRAGTRHRMPNAAVKELAHDERLLRLAHDALGRPATPFRATLFAKSGAANWLIPWHQDTALPLETKFDDPEWQSWSQKAGISYAHAPC